MAALSVVALRWMALSEKKTADGDVKCSKEMTFLKLLSLR